MGIFVSIAYKFVIVSPEVFMYENLDQTDVRFKTPGLMVDRSIFDEQMENGIGSWISDFPGGVGTNQAFLHQYETRVSRYSELDADLGKPPLSVVMTGRATCSTSFSGSVFYRNDSGYIFTREIVMVANMTVDKGEFFIMQNESNTPYWTRIETFADVFQPSSKAILEYIVPGPGHVQVQWARVHNRFSETFREPVAQRVTYRMHYAVAQVDRHVESGGSSRLTSIDSSRFRILSASNGTLKDYIRATDPIISEEGIDSNLAMGGDSNYYSPWVEALGNGWDASLLGTVNDVIRSVMSIYQSAMPQHGHVDADEEPFGSEEATGILQEYPHAQYPFYVGWRAEKNTGCYVFAAVILIILGVFAVLAGAFRIWLGPPTLTSWMGQHVYLAQTNAMSLSDKAASLATGHQAADPDLGRLRLSTKIEQMETDAILQLNVMTGEATKEAGHEHNTGAAV